MILMMAGGRVGAATLDSIVFGDTASEAKHSLVATASAVCQNELALCGSGRDCWDRVDAFFFRYQSLTGDGWIQARVIDAGNSDNWAKAGVMMREALTAGASNAFMFQSGGEGLHSQWRSSADGGTNGGTAPEKFSEKSGGPFWVKVQRAGKVFTMSVSADGKTWTAVSNETIAMADTIYMGLVVCAHNDSVRDYATFDQVATSNASGSWTDADVGKVELAGSAQVNGLGESSRRLLPLDPPYYYGGDLVFRMAVDPNQQNYCTIKLWGSEGTGAMGRVLLDVDDGNGNWREIGMRHGPGPDIFIDQVDAVSPGAFWFKTMLLPRWYTQGKKSVLIRLRATGPFNAYGAIWNYDTYQGRLTRASRGLYRFYTHDDPVLVPAGEKLGTPPSYATAPTRSAAGDTDALQAFKNELSKHLTDLLKSTNPKGAELDTLAKAYEVSWTSVFHSPDLASFLVKSVDATCQAYYAEPKKAGEEWGGAYGSHGFAIARTAPLLKPRLEEKVDLGGGARSHSPCAMVGHAEGQPRQRAVPSADDQQPGDHLRWQCVRGEQGHAGAGIDRSVSRSRRPALPRGSGGNPGICR